MRAAAKAYVDSPDRTAGSIVTTNRNHVGFLAFGHAARSLNGGTGLLKRIREAEPMTIYLRIPPQMLTSHGALPSIWLGTILQAVSERQVRPSRPDHFLVDEAATLGDLDELLTAASRLRGYGLKTWTFWAELRPDAIDAR